MCLPLEGTVDILLLILSELLYSIYPLPGLQLLCRIVPAGPLVGGLAPFAPSVLRVGSLRVSTVCDQH